MSQAVTLELGSDGILVATMNLPGRPMNVVGDVLMEGIAAAVGKLADPAVKGMVLTSGKVDFCAGGDLDRMSKWSTPEEPFEMCRSLKKVLIIMAVFAVITGGAFSWFASTYPDGLEWTIEKIYGKPEIPGKENQIKEGLSKLQEKTAVLPDYSLPSKGEQESKTAWPAVDSGTSLSGIIGAILVLGLILLFGIGIKIMRRHRENR